MPFSGLLSSSPLSDRAYDVDRPSGVNLYLLFGRVHPSLTFRPSTGTLTFLSGCPFHHLLYRAHHRSPSVCSIFDPTSASPSGARKRLYIRWPIRILANTRTSGCLGARPAAFSAVQRDSLSFGAQQIAQLTTESGYRTATVR